MPDESEPTPPEVTPLVAVRQPLRCRWCHKEVTHEEHAALQGLLNTLRHPFTPMRGQPPQCPGHVAVLLSQEAQALVARAERQATREPWRHAR